MTQPTKSLVGGSRRRTCIPQGGQAGVKIFLAIYGKQTHEFAGTTGVLF